MILLKQSTAATMRVGPFVDVTNGATPETGVTLSGADQAELLKATGATVDIAAATFAAITGAGGWYDLSLTTSHTDTLGMLTVVVQDESLCLPVFVRAMVVPAQVWDSLVGGTDLLDANASQLGGTAQTGRDVGASVLISSGTGTGQLSVTSGVIASNVTQAGGSAISQAGGLLNANATQISGDATAADNLETVLDDTAGAVPWIGIVDQGTAQAATGTTLQIRSAAAFANDELIGCVIVITGGSAGVGQARVITDYVSSTDTATVDTWTTTPTGTITYKIFAAPPGSASAPVPAQVVDITAAGAAKLFSVNSGTTYASAVAGSVVKETADNAAGGGLDAAGVRAAVGLATANLDTQLTNIDNFIDTEVAAIVTTLGTPAGVSVSADIAAVKAETAAILVDTAEIGTAGAGLTNINLPNQTMDIIGNITGNLSGSVGSVTGAVGSVTGAVGSVTGAVGSVTGAVGSVTGSVGSLDTQAKADVKAEAVAALATDTYAEPAAIAAATSSLKDKIGFVFTYLRNKRTQTATTETLRNDGDLASIGTRTVSDDGTTMTKGKVG